MADLLGTGLSSLRAMQRALDTTAHNIANVSTEGYTRQRVEFATRNPQAYGSNWIGSGVDAVQVRRVYDQFLSVQARTSSGNLARLETYAAQAGRLDSLLGDSSNGLSNSLQSFTDAINEVSSTPSSISARQVLLAEGNALAERLKGYDARLREMSADIDSQLVGEAGEINVLAKNLAQLNGDINTAIQQTGHPPNDLLDQRDRIIDQLSKKVGITVVAEGESTLNVFIGTGQPLVLGTTSSQITTAKDPLDAERVQLALQTPSGTVDISRSVSGGEIGGLMDWRQQMLDPARNELGRITLAVASQVNAQHAKGMDLAGALGGSFFNVGTAGAVPATTNSSSATATATRVDLGALTTNDYVVTRTGTGYTVRRQDTGVPVTFSGAGTNTDPLLFDGLSVVVDPSVADGDQFVIHPTRDAIRGFGVAITDPARVAAAAALKTASGSANTGTGTIGQAAVLTPGSTTLDPVDIVFTSATTYSVNGGADQAFTPGGNIEVNGWRVQVSGAPASGDTFTVRSNAGAVGDNRNAFALADAMKSGAIENGTVSVTSAVERMTGNLGLQTRAAQMGRDAAAAINDSDLAARDAVSGVNLDEEAANMLRYQQAYQAAAQIIAAANQMFDTLINAVRR